MRRHLQLLAERLAVEADTLGQAFERFRETKLFVQASLSAGLVAVTLIVHTLPFGPLGQVDKSLAWMVSHDIEWQAHRERIQAWVDSHGGWKGAFRHAWQRVDDRRQAVLEWLPRPAKDETGGPVTRAETAATYEAPVSTQTGTTMPTEGAPLMPVDGAVLYGIGWRRAGDKDELHKGIDLAAEGGAPVRAMAPGKVLRLVARDPQWGGIITVQHGEYIAVYAQIEEPRVQAGDEVRAGQVMAQVASQPVGSEKDLGPHLHLELYLKSQDYPIDPMQYLGIQGSGT